MFEVNGNLLQDYSEFVRGGIEAFLPLMLTVISIFLAFAIANMLRHFLLKMK